MASQQDLVHHLVEHFCMRISGGSIQSSPMTMALPQQQQQHTTIYTLGHGPLSSSWTSLSESANSLAHLRQNQRRCRAAAQAPQREDEGHMQVHEHGLLLTTSSAF